MKWTRLERWPIATKLELFLTEVDIMVEPCVNTMTKENTETHIFVNILLIHCHTTFVIREKIKNSIALNIKMYKLILLIPVIAACRINITLNHEGACQRTSTDRLVCQYGEFVSPISSCIYENDFCNLRIKRSLIGNCQKVAGDRWVCVAGNYMDPFPKECQ
jgi:hypothetical protein